MTFALKKNYMKCRQIYKKHRLICLCADQSREKQRRLNWLLTNLKLLLVYFIRIKNPTTIDSSSSKTYILNRFKKRKKSYFLSILSFLFGSPVEPTGIWFGVIPIKNWNFLVQFFFISPSVLRGWWRPIQKSRPLVFFWKLFLHQWLPVDRFNLVEWRKKRIDRRRIRNSNSGLCLPHPYLEKPIIWTEKYLVTTRSCFGNLIHIIGVLTMANSKGKASPNLGISYCFPMTKWAGQTWSICLGCTMCT